MLTIQEIIAKRKELWPTATTVDAKNAITPVSPTTNANVAQLEANRARVQSQIASGERPAVGTSVTPQAEQTQAPTPPPAPVTSSTTPSGATMSDDGTVTPAPINPTPTPVTPETPKVEPVKPVTPTKTEPVVDYTQAKGREAEIQANLDSFKAKWMTPDEIMRASDYQNASPEKKALIEPYLKQQVPTASAMYNLIATKSDIPDEKKTSLPFKIAQNRYTKASSYSTMTPSQLANEMDNSRFIQGSQAYDDVKAMNPKLVQDTENLRIVNGKKQNIFTYTNNPDGTPVKVNNLENTFAQDYIDNFGEEIKKLYAVQTPEQIRAIINTPDVIAAQDKATQIELSMNEIEKQIEAVDKSVEEEMTWSGATWNRIALEKAIRKDKLEKEYNSQLKNYTTYANKANNLITQNTTLYTTSQAQKLAQANAMLPILQDQYKTAQAKAEAEVALKDPATAIKSVMDEMAKIGVNSTESLQTKIQKAKEFIANGGTIGQYVDEMKKLYTEKPEYKAYLAKQGGTEWQSTNITRYNPATGANESTPVFYRKKTDGSFEAVDLSGNKIDASSIGGWISGTPWAISSTGDMSGLASNYPYEASFKNNNTSGITWGMSARTKWLLEKAGIKISEGTARPSREGGKYVKFDNISDWLLAHKILLSQAGSDDINARLQQWVWTKEWPTYAKNLMDQAWIKAWTKFSQLTPEQLDKLVMVQVKKESPWMYKELTKWTTSNTTVQASASDQKAFESYDGKTIPEQYKTPAEKKIFVDKYNAWRASRPWAKIETGNDILNIKIEKPTEWQSASQSYTSRMLNAVNNLMPLEKKFLELGTWWQVAQTYLPALLKSSDQKMMDAEKKNFITAVLRKQSGASIAPSEFAGEEMKYFPQPWDSKEVVIAKQNARNAEIKAMLATAWVDAEWNSLSKYYNPPIISQSQSSTSFITPTTTESGVRASNGQTYKFR